MPLGEEDAIDEALRESFPASDAPAWTSAHAGTPSPRVASPRLLRDVVQSVRDDVRFVVERPSYLEEQLAGLGLACKRRPHDSINVEAMMRGDERPDHSVVIAAGLEAPCDLAVLLSLARAFAGRATRRTIRFVALGSTVKYVDDLLGSGPKVDLMIGLERLGRGTRFSVVSAGAAIAMPRWGRRACHHLAFARRRIPALMLTDVGQCRECDFERVGLMAQAVEQSVTRFL